MMQICSLKLQTAMENNMSQKTLLIAAVSIASFTLVGTGVFAGELRNALKQPTVEVTAKPASSVDTSALQGLRSFGEP